MTSLILIVVLHILIYQGLAFSMSPAQTSALAAETSAIAYGFSGTIMAAFVMGVIGIVLAILYARKENK